MDKIRKTSIMKKTNKSRDLSKSVKILRQDVWFIDDKRLGEDSSLTLSARFFTFVLKQYDLN